MVQIQISTLYCREEWHFLISDICQNNQSRHNAVSWERPKAPCWEKRSAISTVTCKTKVYTHIPHWGSSLLFGEAELVHAWSGTLFPCLLDFAFLRQAGWQDRPLPQTSQTLSTVHRVLQAFAWPPGSCLTISLIVTVLSRWLSRQHALLAYPLSKRLSQTVQGAPEQKQLVHFTWVALKQWSLCFYINGCETTCQHSFNGPIQLPQNKSLTDAATEQTLPLQGALYYLEVLLCLWMAFSPSNGSSEPQDSKVDQGFISWKQDSFLLDASLEGCLRSSECFRDLCCLYK